LTLTLPLNLTLLADMARRLTYRGSGRFRLPLRRRLVFMLLSLRGKRKNGHDRYQRNGDPRAFEGAHMIVFSTATRGRIMDQPAVEIYVVRSA
jgi:hypothetical protein